MIPDEDTVRLITLIIIIVYCIEIAFRIYAYGFKKYFSSILDLIDFIAVLGSECIFIFIFYPKSMFMSIGSLILYVLSIYVVYALLVKVLRWIRVVRTTYRAVFSRTQKLQKAIRTLQRSKLIGYKDEKYDLDIAYITDHILIMSRPATKALQKFSHDALVDVQQFLDEKHKEHYRIYDCCVYQHVADDHGDNDEEDEHGQRVHSRSPTVSTKSDSMLMRSLSKIDLDHHDGPNVEYTAFGDGCISNEFAFRGSSVLSMDKLFLFAEEAMKYQDESPENVVIIQSTSGLGRSMFLCTVLLFYYYPKASLMDIVNFIHHERVHDDVVIQYDKDGHPDALELFSRFIPIFFYHKTC